MEEQEGKDSRVRVILTWRLQDFERFEEFAGMMGMERTAAVRYLAHRGLESVLTASSTQAPEPQNEPLPQPAQPEPQAPQSTKNLSRRQKKRRR